MSELGKLLRQLRGKQSLRDIGRRAGTSHTYISIIEKGIDPRSGKAIKPTPEMLKTLSKTYNYSYSKLMELCGYLPEAHKEEEGTLTDQQKTELDRVLQRADQMFQDKGLDEDDRRRVTDMLTMLFYDSIEESSKS